MFVARWPLLPPWAAPPGGVNSPANRATGIRARKDDEWPPIYFPTSPQSILKCQVSVNGKLTAWCAQHDEKDYKPRSGRTYELVSLSGSESVGIVKLLMSLEHPGPEIMRSVRAAIEWFEMAKLTGIKVVRKEDPSAPKGSDKVVVPDPNAKPMWARFYEIGTNKPLFSDRDGVAKSSLAEIGYERRNGYSWLGYWPEGLLEKDYPAWKTKWGSE